MSNQTPSRLGAVQGAGDPQALFVKVFSGEVLTIFENENKTKDRVMVRTIEHGKSASFPVMGRASAFYHVPGNELLGGTIKHNEKLIGIDGQLVSPVFIAEIDEAMNHYDVRGHYSTEVGRVLAQTWDQQVLQVGVLAARTAVANITGEGFGGTVLSEGLAGDFDDPEKVVDAFFAAAQTMDEKNIPEAERTAYVKPALYYRLIKSERAINRDFGGEGSVAKGKVWEIAGIEIVKTNNLPSTNVLADTVLSGSRDAYIGDFTKTEALFMHKSAVGTVKLLDLATRMDYDPRRLGHQVVSKYAVGHGVLRPEAAIELRRL